MTKNFRQISIRDEDIAEYRALAEELSAEFGVKVSVPALIRLAVSQYMDNRMAPPAGGPADIINV